MNPYGFDWGPVSVERACTFPRKGGECHVLNVKTEHRELHVYVSPTGRSVRVFSDGIEWKPESVALRGKQ